MSDLPSEKPRGAAMGRAILEGTFAFVLASVPLLFLAMIVGCFGGPIGFSVAAGVGAAAAGFFGYRCGRWEWVRSTSTGIPCEQCGYDLRTTKRGTCPECGVRFRRV